MVTLFSDSLVPKASNFGMFPVASSLHMFDDSVLPCLDLWQVSRQFENQDVVLQDKLGSATWTQGCSTMNLREFSWNKRLEDLRWRWFERKRQISWEVLCGHWCIFWIYIYLIFFAPLPFNDSLVILVVDFKKKIGAYPPFQKPYQLEFQVWDLGCFFLFIRWCKTLGRWCKIGCKIRRKRLLALRSRLERG